MSDHKDFGNGDRIVPSARKGIHSTRDNMTRYGLDSKSTDEVDNVMSKPQHPSTPHLMRKNVRRHSITPPCQSYSEDADDDEFNAREAESPTFDQDRNRIWEHVASLSSTSESIHSANSSFSTQSQNVLRLNQSEHINQESKSVVRRILLISLCVAIVAVLCIPWKSPLTNHVYDELRFHSDLNDLGAEYKIDGNSILQLQTGISTIYKKEDTSCLIFVYNSMSRHFNSLKFNGFVNNVASKAAKFLRNNDTESVQYLVVEGSDLKMRSHTQLVKEYRENVAKTGVLLIRDIEHVPSPLAMAFHYYCDEYNPLVKKSAIFFTMNSAKCPNSDEKSSHAAVEKCLKEKWSTVPKDNIGPLLTRVVSIVVDVTNGF